MDRSKEEKAKHSTGYIPYSYYKGDIPILFPLVDLHWHNEIELSYVIDGMGEFICGEDKIIAKKGDIVIIPQTMLHAIFPYKNSSLRYDTLVFSRELLGAMNNGRSIQEFLAPILNNFKCIHINNNHCYYEYIRCTVENIFSCIKGNSAKLDFLMKIELSKLFWLLENNGDIVKAHNSDSLKNEIIRKSLEFIENNYTKEITIEQIADYVNLSKSYFMNSFKNIVGISAIEYITRLRIKNACELLTSGDASIIQIAFECGFNNIANFNRHYKRIMGLTPKEYRILNR